MRLGLTHFLMKRLKDVRTEMALSMPAYNLARVISLLGITPLIQAIRTKIVRSCAPTAVLVGPIFRLRAMAVAFF